MYSDHEGTHDRQGNRNSYTYAAWVVRRHKSKTIAYRRAQENSADRANVLRDTPAWTTEQIAGRLLNICLRNHISTSLPLSPDLSVAVGV